MSGLAPSHTYGSDSSNNEFAVIEYLDLLCDNYLEIVSTAITESLEQHKDDLKNTAANMPEWEELASHLDVNHDGSSLNYTLPQQHLPKFMQLEYGDPEHQMRPLLRSFSASNTPSLITDIERRIEEKL